MTAYTPSPPPPPWPSAAPVRRSTTGAKILTFSGAAVLLVALAAGVFAALSFVKVLPTGVLTSAGGPGADVIAVGDVPGSLEADLDAGTYTLWTVSDGDVAVGLEEIVVEGAGETVVSAPAVDGSTTRAGLHGESLADLTVSGSGDYTITVLAEPASSQTQVYLTPGTDFSTFFAGIGVTVLAWFVAIGGGLLGFGLLAGGIVWWVVARSHNARMSATRHGADT